MQNRFIRLGSAALLALAGAAITGCQPAYRAEIAENHGFAGMDVKLSDAGGVFWKVEAKNNTDAMARLLWDESSYVRTTGESSRIVRGQSRSLHSDQPQPASPIPPGATLSERFVDEASAGNGRFGSRRPADPTRPAKIYLVFDMNGTRQTQVILVNFVKNSD